MSERWNTDHLPTRVDSARIVSVILVETTEGRSSQDSPVRRVLRYFDPETGTLIAHVDLWEEDTP